jgi:hypothetical protein
MRRTVAYLNWKAMWWHSQAGWRTDVDSVTFQGLTGYAMRQAQVLESLAASCVKRWKKALLVANVALPASWESYFAGEQTESNDPSISKGDCEKDDSDSDEELDEEERDSSSDDLDYHSSSHDSDD